MSTNTDLLTFLKPDGSVNRYVGLMLRTVCSSVNIVSGGADRAKCISSELEKVVCENNAFGAAAPQIRYYLRIINVCGKTMINPVLVDTGVKRIKFKEGCLSFPGLFINTTRSEAVKVVYYDINGKLQRGELSGIESVCFQHELDHLNGTLFFQNASEAELRRSIEDAESRGYNYRYEDLYDLIIY